jgi:2-phosphosulpholactate phosphatase
MTRIEVAVARDRGLDLVQRLGLPMDISIHSPLEGATRATGTVAIIDVFRAFSTAAVALANGASAIVMVGTIEEALGLRDAGVGQICMGEVRGRTPEGFDYGNSPFGQGPTPGLRPSRPSFGR